MSLTGHWIDENFQKISAVLAIEELLGSTLEIIYVKNSMLYLSNGKLKRVKYTLCYVTMHASNTDKAMRDAGVASYGCFAHSLQLVVNDGVLSQRSVSDLLAICDLICRNPEQSRIYGYSVSCFFVLYVLYPII